ncbi:TrmH family RNA methyltransferase [Streptococcus hongkongensis]
MIITSKANPLIKQTKKLLTKKHRKVSYLIEGWHLFDEAQKANQEFIHIFLQEDMADKLRSLEGVTLVTYDILKELTDSPNPQGIIAEVRMPITPMPNCHQGKYLLLEDVQDPGNLGTLIRTADAAGFTGVFLSEKSADLYNPKTLRSMQGSHFHLPVWRQDPALICQNVKENGLPIIASTLSDQSVDYHVIEKPASFVLVMGNEGSGISPQMSDIADTLVHITMPGQAESLNVAVAGGILIFSLI